MKLKNIISIVIPAYNEELYIGNLLDSIRNQFFTKDVAIFVADGGSTDKTVEICETYKSCLNIKVIKGGSVSRGRNAGLAKVKTEFVLFIDADAVLSNPFHIFDAYTLLKKYKVVGTKLRSDCGKISGLVYKLFNYVNAIISKRKPFAVGSFCGYQTKSIKEKGGWDETVIHGEDWLLSSKFTPEEFAICSHCIIVDDRRFKKTGYFGMLKLMLLSAWLGESYMKKDHGYWN